ncbi:putative (R)-mandelonitrile lyase [Rosa chinensis]|uniref:Putative (R)-mandelonitrile lyase n=1 Tax=Rosa chinensis TaxID=74649 RepID=A0A2P6RKV8_ROSCH|nr:putative (R)-mandelonitrile lyase [Rosa chinensis]
MEKILGPVSAGSLRLASTDVKVNPIIQFNYFNSPVVSGCDVRRTKSMDDFKFQGWFGNKDFRFIGPALPVDQSDFDQMQTSAAAL